MSTNKNEKAKTYRLASSELVNTPGLLRWAMCGYRTGDRRLMLRVITEGYPGVTRQAAIRLLSGEVEHVVTEDGAVEFTA